MVLSAVCLLLIFLSVSAVFADEESEMWARVYKQAPTVRQKYEIMQSIVELNNPDIIPVLIEALEVLNEQDIYRDHKDKVVQSDLKILILNELGELKANEASAAIFRAMKEAENAQLKGEAMIALGKTGANYYTFEIALVLRNLTLYRGEDLLAEEAIAHGCIKALEELKDPVGYLPVFLTAHAGFSRKITQEAEQALDTMVDDPSDILMGLIKYESSFDLKVKGLEAEDRSRASSSRKVEVATEALRQGLENKPSDVEENTSLSELRTKAMGMLIKYKVQNRDALPLLERVFYINNSDNEKAFAIETLKAMASTESAEILTRYLAFQNDRKEFGYSPQDNRIVIATVRALGEMNSRVGYEELLKTKYSGYPAVVNREVDMALKQLDR
jgi:hypothetical protein